MWCLISVLPNRRGLQTVWIVLWRNPKALPQRIQDFLPYLFEAQGHGISQRPSDPPARTLPHETPLSFLPLRKAMPGAAGGWPKAVKGAAAKQGSVPFTSWHHHMQNALLQPAWLITSTLQGVPCASSLLPDGPRRWSRHLMLIVWEQREQRGWAYSSWLLHCRMGALSWTSRDGTGSFTELKQE